MDYIEHSLAEVRKVLRNTPPVETRASSLGDELVDLETVLFPDGRPEQEEEVADGGQ